MRSPSVFAVGISIGYALGLSFAGWPVIAADALGLALALVTLTVVVRDLRHGRRSSPPITVIRAVRIDGQQIVEAISRRPPGGTTRR